MDKAAQEADTGPERSARSPSAPGKRTGTDALSPGRRLALSPALVTRVGATLSDGAGFSYLLDADGGFVVTMAPPAHARAVGRRITPDGRFAGAWRALTSMLVPAAEVHAGGDEPSPAPGPGAMPDVHGDDGAASGGLADGAEAILLPTNETPEIAMTTKAPSGSGPTLDPVRLERALCFYAEHRSQYVPGVIRAIGTKIGLPSAVEVDAAFVERIASYQTAHGLRGDGIANAQTMVSMFGRDIRMAANAVDPEQMESSDGMARVNDSVVVTPAIREAWALLLPFLPKTARMTSGVRTWEKTVALLIGYVQKKSTRMIALGLTTRAEIDHAIAAQDYGTLHRLGNLDYDTDGDGDVESFVVAGPGNSPHVTGFAFDVAGADLGAIDQAIKHACTADPTFGAMFQKTIVETGNRCVHVELKGAHIIKK
jgi:hypothetical protein